MSFLFLFWFAFPQITRLIKKASAALEELSALNDMSTNKVACPQITLMWHPVNGPVFIANPPHLSGILQSSQCAKLFLELGFDRELPPKMVSAKYLEHGQC